MNNASIRLLVFIRVHSWMTLFALVASPSVVSGVAGRLSGDRFAGGIDDFHRPQIESTHRIFQLIQVSDHNHH